MYYCCNYPKKEKETFKCILNFKDACDIKDFLENPALFCLTQAFSDVGTRGWLCLGSSLTCHKPCSPQRLN